MSRFDWPALMRAGLHGLRMTPHEFWALTPAELRVMLGQSTGGALTQQGLAGLMERWPDEVRGDGDAG